MLWFAVHAGCCLTLVVTCCFSAGCESELVVVCFSCCECLCSASVLCTICRLRSVSGGAFHFGAAIVFGRGKPSDAELCAAPPCAALVVCAAWFVFGAVQHSTRTLCCIIVYDVSMSAITGWLCALCCPVSCGPICSNSFWFHRLPWASLSFPLCNHWQCPSCIGLCTVYSLQGQQPASSGSTFRTRAA